MDRYFDINNMKTELITVLKNSSEHIIAINRLGNKISEKRKIYLNISTAYLNFHKSGPLYDPLYDIYFKYIDNAKMWENNSLTDNEAHVRMSLQMALIQYTEAFTALKDIYDFEKNEFMN